MTQASTPRDSNETWKEIECEAVRRRIIQGGVTTERAAKLVDKYREKLEEGVPPRYAEVSIKPDVLLARRESEVETLAQSLADRFHLPLKTVEKVLAKDIKRLRTNPHLLVKCVAQKHENKLKSLSLEAYNNRRTSVSPLANALVKAGAVTALNVTA